MFREKHIVVRNSSKPLPPGPAFTPRLLIPMVGNVPIQPIQPIQISLDPLQLGLPLPADRFQLPLSHPLPRPHHPEASFLIGQRALRGGELCVQSQGLLRTVAGVVAAGIDRAWARARVGRCRGAFGLHVVVFLGEGVLGVGVVAEGGVEVCSGGGGRGGGDEGAVGVGCGVGG